MLSQVLTCLLCLFNCQDERVNCFPPVKERKEEMRRISQKNVVGTSDVQSKLSQNALAIIQSPHIRTSVNAKKVSALQNQ